MPASSQKIIALLFCIYLFATSSGFAQTRPTLNPAAPSDTIYANTQPVRGFKPFVFELQAVLSLADTLQRRHRVRVNNIAFIVTKTGTIDSAWVMFRPRPIHNEIIKFLKTSRWIPARVDGQPVVSIQDIDIEIYLTKAALKRHRHWRSLAERIITPWSY